MRLVKFHIEEAGEVYLNPDHIQCLFPRPNDGTYFYLTGDESPLKGTIDIDIAAQKLCDEEDDR